jgi:hypothetical protein
MLLDDNNAERYPGKGELIIADEVHTTIAKLAELNHQLLREHDHNRLLEKRDKIAQDISRSLKRHPEAKEWKPGSELERADHHMWVIAERNELFNDVKYKELAEEGENRLRELLIGKLVTVYAFSNVDPKHIFTIPGVDDPPDEITGRVTGITGLTATIGLQTEGEQDVTAHLLTDDVKNVDFQAYIVVND